MTTITINETKLTIDQIRVIRIGLAGFLEALNESRLDGFRNYEMETEYKLLINEIFKLIGGKQDG